MGAFPSTVQTSSGQTFHLAKQIGQGGEGAIYEIREKNDVALKLYWPTKADSRRDKISAMASAQWYKTNSFVTFPIDILLSQTGAFLGFVIRDCSEVQPALLVNAAARVADRDNAGAGGVEQLGGDGAGVAETLNGHARAFDLR